MQHAVELLLPADVYARTIEPLVALLLTLELQMTLPLTKVCQCGWSYCDAYLACLCAQEKMRLGQIRGVVVPNYAYCRSFDIITPSA